jgi:hypothetical protein
LVSSRGEIIFAVPIRKIYASPWSLGAVNI